MRPVSLAALAVAALLAPAPGLAATTGEPAPAFTLPDAGGAAVALDKLKGRVVYVDFWASWCGPCKRSFPWMGEMQKKYGDGGFTVVAINVDKKREDASKFLAATPGAFTIVFALGAYFVTHPSGLNALAFVLVLGLSGFGMWRVWRDQHTYGY